MRCWRCFPQMDSLGRRRAGAALAAAGQRAGRRRRAAAEAVAAIETAARECEVRGETDRAALLREASTTLRAVMRPDALRRAETDIARADGGRGHRDAPRTTAGDRAGRAADAAPRDPRHAACGDPLRRTRARRSRRRAFFARTASCMAGAVGWSRTWTGCRRCGYGGSTGSSRRTCLTAGFKRREDFDLATYAAQSFGVFQEEPTDVVLRFAPESADDAAGWVFHPSQSIEREADGALTVRFRAGGMQEMCWHLFTWGTTVAIMKPVSLRQELAGSVSLLRNTTVCPHDGRRH